MAVVALFCAALAVYVGRDALAKWGMFARFGRRRLLSFACRRFARTFTPAAVQRFDCYTADIAAVETRLEAYRSMGGGGDAARLCFAPPERRGADLG
ncbi:MAG: hypothetical protein WDM79_18185 [Terricaulis sp.]